MRSESAACSPKDAERASHRRLEGSRDVRSTGGKEFGSTVRRCRSARHRRGLGRDRQRANRERDRPHAGPGPSPDVNPTITKRHRLFNALAERQNKDRVGNCVVAFLTEAMAPVRYRDSPAIFSHRQDDLNEVLIHAGYRITDQGKVGRDKGGKATTLEQAAERAGNIRTELCRRGTHPDLLRYCTVELLQKNNFHALLEAAKSIPDRIRRETGEIRNSDPSMILCTRDAGGPAIDSGTQAVTSRLRRPRRAAARSRGLPR